MPEVELRVLEETTDSGERTYAAPGDISHAKRSFVLEARYLGAIDPEDWFSAFPTEGEVLDKLYGDGAGGDVIRRRLSTGGQPCNRWDDYYVLRTIEIAPDPRAAGTYRLTEHYSTLIPFTEGFERPYVKVTRTAKSRPTLRYRRNPTIPALYSPSDNPLVDIGGTSIDVNGHPYTIQAPQVLVTVDVIRDFSAPAPGEDVASRRFTQNMGAWEALTTLALKRNAVEFLGYPAGSLLYLGTHASQVHHEWMVLSHQYLFDSLGHMDQRPIVGPDGNPIMIPRLTVSIGGADTTVLSAAYVVFYQEFGTTVDFWEAGEEFALTGSELEWLDGIAFTNYANCTGEEGGETGPR